MKIWIVRYKDRKNDYDGQMILHLDDGIILNQEVLKKQFSKEEDYSNFIENSKELRFSGPFDMSHNLNSRLEKYEEYQMLCQRINNNEITDIDEIKSNISQIDDFDKRELSDEEKKDINVNKLNELGFYTVLINVLDIIDSVREDNVDPKYYINDIQEIIEKHGPELEDNINNAVVSYLSKLLSDKYKKEEEKILGVDNYAE